MLAAEVRRHVRGGLLTYSDRRRLIAVGRSLGFSAFHANLVIAMVQHEGTTRNEQAPRAPRGAFEPSNRQIRRRGFVVAAVGVLSVQSLIVAGVWFVLS